MAAVEELTEIKWPAWNSSEPGLLREMLPWHPAPPAGAGVKNFLQPSHRDSPQTLLWQRIKPDLCPLLQLTPKLSHSSEVSQSSKPLP